MLTKSQIKRQVWRSLVFCNTHLAKRENINYIANKKFLWIVKANKTDIYKRSPLRSTFTSFVALSSAEHGVRALPPGAEPQAELRAEACPRSQDGEAVEP